MAFNDESYNRFNFYIEPGVESLRETEEWKDSKIAFYLRDMAQSLDPKGRKSKKITIDPLRISDKELLEYPENIQNKVKDIRNKLSSLTGSEKKEVREK